MNWQSIDEIPLNKRVLLHIPIKGHKVIFGIKTNLGLMLEDRVTPVLYPPTHFCEIPERPDCYI